LVPTLARRRERTFGSIPVVLPGLIDEDQTPVAAVGCTSTPPSALFGQPTSLVAWADVPPPARARGDAVGAVHRGGPAQRARCWWRSARRPPAQLPAVHAYVHVSAQSAPSVAFRRHAAGAGVKLALQGVRTGGPVTVDAWDGVVCDGHGSSTACCGASILSSRCWRRDCGHVAAARCAELRRASARVRDCNDARICTDAVSAPFTAHLVEPQLRISSGAPLYSTSLTRATDAPCATSRVSPLRRIDIAATVRPAAGDAQRELFGATTFFVRSASTVCVDQFVDDYRVRQSDPR